jgi:flagellar hook-associated protein 2
MASVPAFRASGLASGMDTAGLVDKLVELESRPLKLLAQRQAGITTQLSTIGTLMSRLEAFATAARGLASGGVSSITNTGTYADFTLSGSATAPARYSIQVEEMARAAKARSTAGFASPDSLVTGADPKGITIAMDGGAPVSVTVAANTSLADVAAQINKEIPAVSASVITNGSQYFLSVTRRETGFVGTTPDDSLAIGDDTAMGLTRVQDGVNARLFVDGLEVKSRKNEVANVIPGVTISLKGESKALQDVTFNRDVAGTLGNLQKFVDAYNGVATVLQENLRPESGTDKETLVSGSVVRNLQSRLQGLLSTTLQTGGAVQTLGDAGVKLGKDGTISIDKAKLEKALTADPKGIDGLFSKATTGLGESIDKLVRSHTSSLGGALHERKSALQGELKRIDARSEKIKEHLESTRERLVKQFSAMEQMMTGFQAIGRYLDAQTYGQKDK